MKTKAALIIVFITSILNAASILPASFKTTKGIEIRNGTIKIKTEDSVRIMHDGGITTLHVKDLPPEIVSLVGFATVSTEDEKPLPDPLVTPKHSFQKAELAGVDPDGIRILHKDGSAKINYENLPTDLKEAFGPFDPELALHFRDQQKEQQKVSYREAQEFKAEQNKIATQTSPAAESAQNNQKQKLLDDPTLISPSVAVHLTARSSGGKYNSQSSDGVTNTKETASVRNITCSAQSKSGGYQRLRLQCLLLTRPAFVDGPLTPELAGETNVDLAPDGAKIVEITAEAVRTDQTRTIGQLTTAYASYTIYLRTRSGVKYIGWSIRAIDGSGRVCAVTSSIPHYDRFAWQTPVK
ncbi:MAG: hypothetical protein K9N47_11140 [Prosthecobacter sp.]|uniref:hypothetical protein n=1 Tax=Prosthecobacter sp. TaxID=1965333 RepID=UPI0025D0A222|nr:hypothetical protein [Prosthecobacter sp.]MCF7786668.1 hypothetical protein [Prosthecobacter sp.]